jgi:hypothetical protein
MYWSKTEKEIKINFKTEKRKKSKISKENSFPMFQSHLGGCFDSPSKRRKF